MLLIIGFKESNNYGTSMQIAAYYNVVIIYDIVPSDCQNPCFKLLIRV